jgi:signal transduction histidine kinase
MRSARSTVPCELRLAYEEERRALSVRAARIIALLCLLTLPPFLWIDATRFPEISGSLFWMRLGLLISPALVLALLATPAGQAHPELLSLIFATIGAATTTGLMAYTGGHESPYFGGIGLGMLLTALLMPWRPLWTWLTCCVLIATYVAFAAALGLGLEGPSLRSNLASYVVTMAIAGFATTSRERLRSREFLARRSLERTAERLEEHARVASVLARAGREMLRVLETPHILERLCALTTEALGCDVSHTIVRDAETGCWKAVAHHGNTPQQWELIRSIRVPAAQTPHLSNRLRQHGVVQIPTADMGFPGSPLELAARAGITLSMFLPLYAGDELVGIQGAGFRGRTEPFTAEQERLAIAMAQLASLALANARLYDELARQSEAERAARSLAESASKAKDDFLATLSHELRTPLNVILGYLDILADPELGGAEREAIISRATVTSRQLFYMITDTLEISRLHSGQVGPHVEAVSLADLWLQLRAECETLPCSPSTQLVWHGDVPDVSFDTDRRMVLVIVRNLVSNGLKFTERGSVRVSGRIDGGVLELEVADTGIGIPPEARCRIFEMFQQVDATDQRRHGGVGLGLYIVERFAAQLGATVDVESTVGVGSKFRVRVPLRSAELADVGASASALPH